MSREKSTTDNGAKRMRVRAGISLLALALAAGCDSNLNLKNPNAPTEETAVSNLEGVIATSLGMEDQFASSILSYVRAPALITDEWGTASKALAADQSLFTGDAIDPSYLVVWEPYYVTYRVARTADLIISTAPSLPISAGIAGGLTANAKLFKAMALGMAAMQYQNLPTDASPAGATPVGREAVFTEVISLLESARTDLNAMTPADSAVVSRALSPGFQLRNTIDAMLARYYLVTGQYQNAITAATRVDLTKVSVLTFPNPAINPIHNYGLIAGYVAPLRSWARQAEPGDKRVAFWADTLATPPIGAPPTVQLVQFRMYSNRNDPFPVYIPGEMLLIRAEAQVRLNGAAGIPAAIALINQVRAEVSTAVTPGAQLPPVSQATLDTPDKVLAQIAYERRYELFEQGLRWEDIRRFGTLAGGAAKASFLPMPQAECLSNPNAGC